MARTWIWFVIITGIVKVIIRIQILSRAYEYTNRDRFAYIIIEDRIYIWFHVSFKNLLVEELVPRLSQNDLFIYTENRFTSH